MRKAGSLTNTGSQGIHYHHHDHHNLHRHHHHHHLDWLILIQYELCQKSDCLPRQGGDSSQFVLVSVVDMEKVISHQILQP